MSYERLGRYGEVLEAFQKAEAFKGWTSQIVSLIGYTYATSGRRKEAERALRELEWTRSGICYATTHGLSACWSS